MRIARRHLLALGPMGAAFSLASLAAMRPGAASAAETGPESDRLAAAYSKAQSIGLTQLAGAPGESMSDNSALALSDLVAKALDKATTGDQQAAQFADEFGIMASDLNALVRDAEPEPLLQGPPPPFFRLRADYKKMFDDCEIDAAHASEVTQACRRILIPEAVAIYRSVETSTGVPWYVVGALHYREASLNFMGHLHNGDFLKRRTYHVPANRPQPPDQWPIVPWDAEKAWIISANDALQRLANLADSWTIEWMLYSFESYNGWGYRNHAGFVSPYLWNYTNYYKGGGFPADHVWSNTYMSRQAGLVSIIKKLKEMAPDKVVLQYTP